MSYKVEDKVKVIKPIIKPKEYSHYQKTVLKAELKEQRE